jgi:hypothetical protein
MRPRNTSETGSNTSPKPGIPSEDIFAVPPLIVMETLARPFAVRVT